jgi:ubiquinone/menaquinone biosynthesis C-methylase UbiE
MSDGWGLERVREFWTEQAMQHGASPDASWSDVEAIELEIRHILELIEDGDRVLDVGCATGWSTVRWATEKKVHVRGLDYIPEMIEHARAGAAELEGKLAGTVEYDVGDIAGLNEPSHSWDKVIVTRVVINLGEWEHQARALHEVARVVKPGGLLLLSEATVQGWDQLNGFRAEWGLDPIPMPPFNTYLDQDRVVETLSESMELLELRDFASTYYVGSRVLKPLLAKALGGNVDVADPRMHWNRWMAHLPAAGDYGTQKLFILRKK